MDVIRALWGRSGRVYVDRMKLPGIMRTYGRYSTLRRKTRRFFNQCATGTISMMTLLAAELGDEVRMGLPQVQ